MKISKVGQLAHIEAVLDVFTSAALIDSEGVEITNRVAVHTNPEGTVAWDEPMYLTSTAASMAMMRLFAEDGSWLDIEFTWTSA